LLDKHLQANQTLNDDGHRSQIYEAVDKKQYRSLTPQDLASVSPKLVGKRFKTKIKQPTPIKKAGSNAMSS